MFKFCPNCANETKPGWKCCPYCGYAFDAPATPAPTAVDATLPNDSALDSALDGLMDLMGERQAETEKAALQSKLRVLIIRGKYDEAKKMCDELIETDPMDSIGYIGLIRITSNNYKKYDGVDIAEQIRIAEEVFGGSDALSLDQEYAEYYAEREKYLKEKAQKDKEEQERRRLEMERAEAERKRLEAERAEAERKRLEAERAEAERKRLEAEKVEAERRLFNEKFAQFKYKDNGNGTYTILSVKDKTIKSAVIPDGVTCIAGAAFIGCSSLTSVKIPNGVTRINGQAFVDCSSLKSITLPNSVTYIGEYAFAGCSSLTSINIPDGVKSIQQGVFAECSSLKSITIPYGVPTIDIRAFYYCTSLYSVTIPGSVTSILSEAFNGCRNLARIDIPRKCSCDGNAFDKKTKVKKR